VLISVRALIRAYASSARSIVRSSSKRRTLKGQWRERWRHAAVGPIIAFTPPPWRWACSLPAPPRREIRQGLGAPGGRGRDSMHGTPRPLQQLPGAHGSSACDGRSGPSVSHKSTQTSEKPVRWGRPWRPGSARHPRPVGSFTAVVLATPVPPGLAISRSALPKAKQLHRAGLRRRKRDPGAAGEPYFLRAPGRPPRPSSSPRLVSRSG